MFGNKPTKPQNRIDSLVGAGTVVEGDIAFSGGPLLAFKTAEDNQRLILRFWNVQDHSARGSLKLPSGWTRAERCDALERSMKPLNVREGRIQFEAEPLGILTVAISKGS